MVWPALSLVEVKVMPLAAVSDADTDRPAADSTVFRSSSDFTVAAFELSAE